MEFLANFKISNDAKKGQRRRHSLKGKKKKKKIHKYIPVASKVILRTPECCFPPVMRSVKTMPWVQGRSRVKPTVSCPEHGSTEGDRKPFRRSLGLETFPNVLMFRSFVPCAGNNNAEAASSLEVRTHNMIYCQFFKDQDFSPAETLTTKMTDKDASKTPQERMKRSCRELYFLFLLFFFFYISGTYEALSPLEGLL